MKKKEVITLIIIILLMWAFAKGQKARKNQFKANPEKFCQRYTNLRIRGIPARCFKYYVNEVSL